MRYGIVHMGSKEDILGLMSYMFEREYNKKYFIDLFCGGLSVSGYCLKHYKNKKVIANDLNKYTIALYEHILRDNYFELDLTKYNFVTREDFYDIIEKNTESYQDWFVGFVMNVYSFGCNQKDYLYAKDLEIYKKCLHDSIVKGISIFEALALNKVETSVFEGFSVPQDVIELSYQKYPKKRQKYMEYFKKFVNSCKKEERYKILFRLLNLPHLTLIEHLDCIKEYINKPISFYSKDYMEVYNSLDESILQNCFIYCDPPYEDTKKYKYGTDFDYEKFWDWFRNCPYSVYVSSYKAPDDIKPLNFQKKEVKLDNGKFEYDGTKERKKATENLYWNGKGNPEPTGFDMLFG